MTGGGVIYLLLFVVMRDLLFDFTIRSTMRMDYLIQSID